MDDDTENLPFDLIPFDMTAQEARIASGAIQREMAALLEDGGQDSEALKVTRNLWRRLYRKLEA